MSVDYCVCVSPNRARSSSIFWTQKMGEKERVLFQSLYSFDLWQLYSPLLLPLLELKDAA